MSETKNHRIAHKSKNSEIPNNHQKGLYFWFWSGNFSLVKTPKSPSRELKDGEGQTRWGP